MMNEHYIYRCRDKDSLRRTWKQKKADAWFSESEWAVYPGFRDKTRREEWLLGRFLAKQLILEHLDAGAGAGEPLSLSVHPAEIQVYSRSGMGRSTPPRVFINGRLLNWSLSIAHSKQSVLVALSKKPGTAIGADIEFLCPQTPGFSAIWLTPAEQTWVHNQGKPHLVSMLWAVKEAAYKAININREFIPRQIEVHFYKPGDCRLILAGKKLAQEHHVYTAELANQAIAIVTIAANEGEGSP